MIFKKFEDTALTYPDNVAIQYKDKILSYKNCLDLINRLSEIFTFKNKAILVFTKKNEYSVLWQLAINKSGNVFCMVDRKTPMDRVEKIIEQLKPSVIISDTDFKEDVIDLLDVIQDMKVYKCKSDYEYNKEVSHVFFSSGSTGVPKGILLKSSPVVDVVIQQAKKMELTVGSRFAWLLSVSFDASLSDVYATILSGGTLYVCDFEQNKIKTLIDFFNKNEITHSDISPSVLNLFNGDEFKTLKCIVFGGEVGNEVKIKNLSKRFKMFNAYGPTEATICTSFKEVGSDWVGNNIGAPLDRVMYLIKDKELLIGGDNICSGYMTEILNKTKFEVISEKIFYKTGDLVEKINDEFYFLGRVDRQFKYNGVLISPEEIERCALDIGCMEVMCRKEDKIILSYVGDISPNDLREKMLKKIDIKMMPHIFIQQNDLKKTLSGKVAI